jgi:hypothetical protein
MNHAQFWGGGGAAPYEIEQSLRFDGSSYLSRTYSSAGNRKTFTISVWVKRSTFDGDQYMFGAYQTGGASQFGLRFYNTGGNETELLYDQGAAAPGGGYGFSQAKYRDASAWYHIVYAADYSNATASDRIRLYVNNERVTQFRLSSNGIDSDGSWNWAGAHYIGRDIASNTNNLKGYMAEVNFVDGTAVTNAEDFGEYDDNGVWRPIRYTGSYGTNGFYLKFDPSATNGIGHDHSGNGNNWTPSGFTTSGTGTDVMSDTPTNNFATLNPLIGYQAGGLLAPIYSNGNLTVAPQVNSGNNSRVASATLARNPADGGVWRWEMVVNNTNNSFYGIMAIDENYGSGNFGPLWGASGLGGTLSTSGGASANLQEQHATISAGDVITIVVSFDDNEIGWYINGTRDGFYNGCNFSDYDQLVPFFKEATRTQTPCTFDVNFGQKAFQYTISGDAWGDLSTLPAPDIADGSEYFSTTLYTGVSGSQSVDAGMATDLAWIKSRSTSQSHSLTDRVRGNDLVLQSNEQSAETSGDIDLTSTGVTIGDNNALRGAAGVSYVLWSWLAGGSGSSNNDGSIPSTVSANRTAGFSIVTYTGNGSSSATVGHDLNATPAMIILKARAGTNANNHWYCWHQKLSSGYNILPSSSSGQLIPSSGVIAAPTNTTNFGFTAGSNLLNVNETNTTYVAYCFAEVEGYSKFGSYTGNGNADGPFVYCGFRPRWIMTKAYTTTSEWVIWDTARDPYNLAEQSLQSQSSSTELNFYDIDVLSNGFKIRTSFSTHNQSGYNYLVAAFAENPFGGDGVSPATAR